MRNQYPDVNGPGHRPVDTTPDLADPPEAMARLPWTPWLSWLVLNLGAAAAALYLAANTAFFPGNTLHNNGNWVSSKVGLEKTPMGAITYLVTEHALRNRRLNLGEWHGFQELLYKEAVRPRRVAFTFCLEDNATLAFIFNKTTTGFNGLRLDNGARAMFFRADASGRFLSRAFVNLKTELSLRCHRLEAVFTPGGVAVTLDRGAPMQYSAPIAGPHRVGFRGGRWQTFIDDVTIQGAGGRTIVEDDFEPRERTLRVLYVCVGVLVLINALMGLRHRRRRIFWPLLLVANAIILLTVGAAHVGARAFLGSYRVDPDSINWHGYRIPEKRWTNLTEQLLARHPPQQKGRRFRIMVGGGSQAWGEGASVARRAYNELLCWRLNRDRTIQLETECINAGLPGAEAVNVLELVRDTAAELRPEMMVAVLGINDRPDPVAFEASLIKLIQQNNRLGIRTLLVAEPMSHDNPKLLACHRIIQRLARKHGVPLLDLHATLRRQRHLGFIWWDTIHLTDLGHELVARALHQQIMLRKRHLLGGQADKPAGSGAPTLLP